MAPDAPQTSIERSHPTASAASTAEHRIGVSKGARQGPLLMLLRGRPAELRRALLAASRHSFANVRAAEPEELHRQRRVEDGTRGAQPVVQRVLRPADRALRACGETACDGERALL